MGSRAQRVAATPLPASLPLTERSTALVYHPLSPSGVTGASVIDVVGGTLSAAILKRKIPLDVVEILPYTALLNSTDLSRPPSPAVFTSAIRTVPSCVPLLVQGSKPWIPSSTAKTIDAPSVVISSGKDDAGPSLMSLTSAAPNPVVFHSSKPWVPSSAQRYTKPPAALNWL